MFQRRVAILLSASSTHPRPNLGAASPYDILGITPSTPFNDVKARFQELARFYHPDMPHGDPNKFREINAAYRILRAQEREKRTPHTDTDTFWAERNQKTREKTHNYTDYNNGRQDRGGKQRSSLFHEAIWLYEGYELALIIGAGVAVVVIAIDRYLLVQRMTREKRAHHRAMDEGMPPSMPMVLDKEMVDIYSEPVPPEELEIDNAMARENVYYRRATQRRFEDFREFMYIFDPNGVTSRKVTTSRFSVQYVEEDLIHQRCALVKDFNSEKKDSRYANIAKDVTETLASTPWESPDTQYISPIVASGLASIPMNSPDTAKWTFIEYQRTDDRNKANPPVCLIALRNHRFDKLGMCQRVTVTGSETLSPKYATKREEELQAGKLTKKALVCGGSLPVKNLSVPLELMKL